jgi:hypothetical protein
MAAPEPLEESPQSRSEQRRRAGERRPSLFREVNEQIEQLSREWDSDEPDTIYCECGHPHCLERIEVTAAAYELVRRFPTRFLVKSGHLNTDTDRIIEESPGHVVVEKRGPAARTAIHDDPRHPAGRPTGEPPR